MKNEMKVDIHELFNDLRLIRNAFYEELEYGNKGDICWTYYNVFSGQARMMLFIIPYDYYYRLNKVASKMFKDYLAK